MIKHLHIFVPELKRTIALSAAVLVTAGSLFAFPDFEEAKSGAEQGDAQAQAVVATYYALGWQTAKDPALAARYAEQSAKAGNPLGKFRLGALIRNGEGVPKDEPAGLRLQNDAVGIWSKGFDEKDPFTLTAIGVALFQGKVAQQDKAQAAQHYKKAADMGFAPAQYNYAMCAKGGQGIPIDTALCSEYLSKAAGSGYRLAQEALGQPTTAVASNSSSDSNELESQASAGPISGGLDLQFASNSALNTSSINGKLSFNKNENNETKLISATGIGESPNSALKNALSNAIQTAVGAMVDSKTVTENEEIIQDRILTVSDGFVKEYKTTKEVSKNENGSYEVEIDAVVQLSQVASALKAANIAVGKVTGDNIWAEATSKVNNIEDARLFLENKLPEYLPKLISIEFLDSNGNATKDINPILRNENAIEQKVKLGWLIRLKVNREYYKSITPYIRHCYSIISSTQPKRFSSKGVVNEVEKKIEWEPAPLGQLKQVFKLSDRVPVFKSDFKVDGFNEGYVIISNISKTGDYIEGEFFNLPKYQIEVNSPLVLKIQLKDADGDIISSNEWEIIKDLDNSLFSLTPLMLSPIFTSKIWGNSIEIQSSKIVDAIFEIPIDQAKEIDSISCEIIPTLTSVKISDYQDGFPKKSRDGMIIPNPW